MNYKYAITKLIRSHYGKDMGDLQYSVDLAKELVTLFESNNIIIPEELSTSAVSLRDNESKTEPTEPEDTAQGESEDIQNTIKEAIVTEQVQNTTTETQVPTEVIENKTTKVEETVAEIRQTINKNESNKKDRKSNSRFSKKKTFGSRLRRKKS